MNRRDDEQPTRNRLLDTLRRVGRTAERLRVPPLIVALIGCASLHIGPAPLGTAAAVVTMPLWLPALSRVKLALALVCSLGLLGVSGAVLYLTATEGTFDAGVTLSVIGITVTGAFMVGAFTWSSLTAGIPLTALAFGLGALANAFVSQAPLDENSWKYLFAYPCALILLSLSYRLRPWVAMSALALIASVSIVGGYRSMFGFCLGAALLYLGARVLVRHPPASGRRDLRPIGFGLGAAGVGYAAYVGLTQLLLSGWLGLRVRESTELAISRGGDIITGGRVEWIATRALFQERPLGFGPGFIPGEHEKQLILDAFAQSGIEPSLQHIRQYVFDGRFKLHAVYADFWVNFGLLATLTFVGVAAFIVAAFVVRATTRTVEPPLLWFVVVVALWDIVFSPIYSNLSYLLLALVLVGIRTSEAAKVEASAS